MQYKQYQSKSGPRRTRRYFVRSKIFQFSLNMVLRENEGHTYNYAIRKGMGKEGEGNGP